MDLDRLKLLKELSLLADISDFNENTEIILTVEKPLELKTQSDAILYFLQKLDVNMVDSILDEYRTYQDCTKKKFIQKLDVAMNEFINFGDTFLNKHSGSCNSKDCNYNCTGFSFIGNKSSNYIDIIFDIKEGAVLDIYECSEFKSDEEGLKKNIQIEIDDSDVPF